VGEYCLPAGFATFEFWLLTTVVKAGGADDVNLSSPRLSTNENRKMAKPFFEHAILDSPYGCPQRRRELDSRGQPTRQIFESRRRANFITPIPKPKKLRKESPQREMAFDEGKGLLTKEQQHDPTSIINEVPVHEIGCHLGCMV